MSQPQRLAELRLLSLIRTHDQCHLKLYTRPSVSFSPWSPPSSSSSHPAAHLETDQDSFDSAAQTERPPNTEVDSAFCPPHLKHSTEHFIPRHPPRRAHLSSFSLVRPFTRFDILILGKTLASAASPDRYPRSDLVPICVWFTLATRRTCAQKRILCVFVVWIDIVFGR